MSMRIDGGLIHSLYLTLPTAKDQSERNTVHRKETDSVFQSHISRYL